VRKLQLEPPIEAHVGIALGHHAPPVAGLGLGPVSGRDTLIVPSLFFIILFIIGGIELKSFFTLGPVVVFIVIALAVDHYEIVLSVVVGVELHAGSGGHRADIALVRDPLLVDIPPLAVQQSSPLLVGTL
jgi:hypothetical protein